MPRKVPDAKQDFGISSSGQRDAVFDKSSFGIYTATSACRMSCVYTKSKIRQEGLHPVQLLTLYISDTIVCAQKDRLLIAAVMWYEDCQAKHSCMSSVRGLAGLGS